MSEQRHYDDQDAEDILRIASREAGAGGMSRDRLLQTAAELGIPPEAVDRAEQQLAKQRETERLEGEDAVLRQQFESERKGKFWTDFLSYIGVNAGLIGIWFMTGAGYFWPGWVLAGWGVGVISDFFQTFFNRDEAKFQRWKRRTHNKLASAKSKVEAAPVLDEIVGAGEISKIEAIKELRERLSVDLREAKQIADRYEEQHPGIFG